MSQVGDGLSLFKWRNFRKLFTAYLISYSGTAMAPIAMAFGVLELTGSARASSIVIAAPIFAQVLILLLGGALADRTSRKRMLILSDSLAMCVQMTIAFMFLSGLATVPALTALMLINGVAIALGAPAATGFIPQIVNRTELQAANALLGVARNSAMMLGAAMAGILVATLGAGWTLLIDGMSFGVSALLIATLTPRQQVAPDNATLLQDIRLGWREFTAHRWLWSIVLQFSLIVAATEAVFGLLGPAVAKLQMGGAVDWGIISASFGAGTLAGGVAGMRLNVERPMLFATFCTLFFCLVPLGLAVPLTVGQIAVLAFAEGVAVQIFSVVWYTTLHKMIAPHLLSRVSAYDHLGSMALAPLGIVTGGFLFEIIGARNTLLIASATIILPTLCVLGVREVQALTMSEVNRQWQ